MTAAGESGEKRVIAGSRKREIKRQIGEPLNEMKSYAL